MVMDNERAWRCHLCHSSHRRVLARLAGKDDPMPEMSLLQFQQTYSENYYQTGWRDRGEGYLDPAKVASMEQEARDQRLEIERLTGLSTGAILDIGCGDGLLTRTMPETCAAEPRTPFAACWGAR